MNDKLRRVLERIEAWATNVEGLVHNDAGESLRRIANVAHAALADSANYVHVASDEPEPETTLTVGSTEDDEGRPYRCGAFISATGEVCTLESDHDGKHVFASDSATVSEDAALSCGCRYEGNTRVKSCEEHKIPCAHPEDAPPTTYNAVESAIDDSRDPDRRWGYAHPALKQTPKNINEGGDVKIEDAPEGPTVEQIAKILCPGYNHAQRGLRGPMMTAKDVDLPCNRCLAWAVDVRDALDRLRGEGETDG